MPTARPDHRGKGAGCQRQAEGAAESEDGGHADAHADDGGEQGQTGGRQGTEGDQQYNRGEGDAYGFRRAARGGLARQCGAAHLDCQALLLCDVDGALQPVLGGVGEVSRLDLVTDGRVRGGGVLAHRLGLERAHDPLDLGAAACRFHELVDHGPVVGRGDLLAGRCDKHDPGVSPVGVRPREALPDQIERLLRLDAWHEGTVVLGLRRCSGPGADGDKDDDPYQEDGPAPTEGRAAEPVQECSHGLKSPHLIVSRTPQWPAGSSPHIVRLLLGLVKSHEAGLCHSSSGMTSASERQGS